MKGYLVLNLNDSDDSLVDANLIMYGKNTSGTKVYVVLDSTDDPNTDMLDASVWYIGDLMFINFWAYESPFYFEILMHGRAAWRDIGFGIFDEEWVASSVRGVNMVWEGFLLGPDVIRTFQEQQTPPRRFTTWQQRLSTRTTGRRRRSWMN